MPIYEYKCADCGEHIEKMRRVSDEPLTVCENCGGKLEKQLSLSGFQFKGEGWYVTDYSKKSSGGKEPKSEKSGEKSSTSDSTAKSDSASKKTTETKTASKKE
jgi:putative FmdB family regulatory protein